MIETQKRAYLEAMGFDVWVIQPPPPEWDRLVVNAGQGSTLLVSELPEHCTSKLAGDIVRAIGGDPVWAWPDPEGSSNKPRLEEVVRDGLFTRVVIFGTEMAEHLFGPKVPDIIVSSAVKVVGDIEELATRGTAKQTLWRFLKPGSGGTGGNIAP